MTFERRKTCLLNDIKSAFNNTNNTAKKITLSNYYSTVEHQKADLIDYTWYYNTLERFGFEFK